MMLATVRKVENAYFTNSNVHSCVWNLQVKNVWLLQSSSKEMGVVLQIFVFVFVFFTFGWSSMVAQMLKKKKKKKSACQWETQVRSLG